jgi:YVTN family beta-propeller protein
VSNLNDNTVSVIDANTNTVTATINVGSGPQGLGVLGTNLYVLNGNDNTVSVIDTNTNTVTATIGNNLASLLSKGFYHPFGLAYDAANQRLFVADANNNRVMVFNVATSSIQNGMSASYVLGQPNFVSNVDLNGTAAQSVLYYPTYLSYDASHQLLYVNDQNNNRVMVFNVATSSIQSGENAESVLGQPNFTSSGTSTLAQNNFNLFGRNAGASKSGGLFIDPVYNHLFITDTYDGRLLQDSLISLSSNTVPNPVLSNSYSATITPINSQGVVTFSVISGSLPVGLSLSSSTGVISGIATATTTATFSIQATDNLTTAQFFDQASYTITPAAGVPASPTAVSATAGNAQASVSFTPGGDGGSTILYYTAVSSPGSMSATSSGSPIVVSGLSNGQGYTFIVTATNGIGTSALSLPSGSVTPSAPGGGSAPTVMAGGGAPNTNNYGIPGSASGASMTSTTSLVLSSLASSTQPLSSSSSSSATTSSEASLQAEIASLEAELQSLMSQMANNSSSIQFTFSRDLQLNDNSLEVKNLQIYLNTHGFPVALKGPGSRGLETTRFGGNTYYALIKFQIKNGIRPTGYFGIITREAMNSHP